jgi:hypothetical protein
MGWQVSKPFTNKYYVLSIQKQKWIFFWTFYNLIKQSYIFHVMPNFKNHQPIIL